jgi:hypothetical protein
MNGKLATEAPRERRPETATQARHRSQQRRFLDAYGEGVLHLGFDVSECDEADKTGAKG